MILFTDLLQIRGGHVGPVLHQFIKWHVREAGAVPPAPELGLPEPVLESQPAESFNHQLSLPEIVGLVNARQMPG